MVSVFYTSIKSAYPLGAYFIVCLVVILGIIFFVEGEEKRHEGCRFNSPIVLTRKELEFKRISFL